MEPAVVSPSIAISSLPPYTMKLAVTTNRQTLPLLPNILKDSSSTSKHILIHYYPHPPLQESIESRYRIKIKKTLFCGYRFRKRWNLCNIISSSAPSTHKRREDRQPLKLEKEYCNFPPAYSSICNKIIYDSPHAKTKVEKQKCWIYVVC